MRFASFITSAVGGFLILCPIVGVAAQGPSRSEWYLGGGIGSNWASDMSQEGWNRETTCYPTDGCFDADPVPELSGYRWRYDIAAAAGAVFEVSAGRFFDRTRLEFSLRQRENGLNQMFRSITEYDGTPLRERSGSSVVSTSQASIDHLTVRTLTLNAYYEFPETFGRISHTWAVDLVPRSSRCPGCTSPRSTRIRLAMLRRTIHPCRSTTAARTLTCPTQSWPATCTLVSTTASPTRHWWG